jgi:ATP-dependent Lhr-like helicase
VRADTGARDAVLLGATDPANPCGVQLPWPAPRRAGASPRRAVGASVVLVDGELAMFLDRAGRGVQTFAPSDAARADAAIERAARALRALFRQRRRAALRLATIDGEPASASPWAPAFLRAGFGNDYKGLVLERSP